MIGRFAEVVDRMVRNSWNAPPGPVSRFGSALFGCGSVGRSLLYEVGVLGTRTAPIPIVSIGGITVGGSGKTPLTSDLAARLCARGVPTAILTHGYADEMDVHRRLCPDAMVYGGRDRHALSLRAAADGARIAFLDSGFQYRRLRRDLDIVALDERALAMPVRGLPAGPYRERLSALERADVLVLTRRTASPDAISPPVDVRGIGRLGRLLTPERWPLTVDACISPTRLVAANDVARGRDQPRPWLAVAGIMWPVDFFATVRQLPEGEHVRSEIAIRDHAPISRRAERLLREAAGDGGLVCTLKDAAKLVEAVGGQVPVWCVEEKVHWDGGDGELLVQAIHSLVSPAPGGTAARSPLGSA